MSREAMQMALDMLSEIADDVYYDQKLEGVIAALRQALVDADDTSEKRVDEMVKTEHGKKIEIAQAYQRGWDAAVAQQEPVAWMYVNEDGECEQIEYGPVFDDPGVTPLYTAPKQWVGLTAYEIQEIHSGNQHWGSFACAIEQALKEKNHGQP